MDNTTKDSSPASNSFPHNGRLLTDYIFDNRLNRAVLARQMNVSNASVYQYAGSRSLQLSILWRASVALNHNFVAELGALLPVEFIAPREKELQERFEELQKEHEKLKIELSVYKTIVGK